MKCECTNDGKGHLIQCDYCRFKNTAYVCNECARWRIAVTKLLDYIEAHEWGAIPEPHDSIRELYELMPERRKP